MLSERMHRLVHSSPAQREALLRSGRGPQPAALAGFEWRGCNLSWRTTLLGLQKFIKGFVQVGARLEGYNVVVVQNGLEAPWLPKLAAGAPRRMGFYYVQPVDPRSIDNLYPQALLLDYGASPRNAGAVVVGALRDYLVQPDPGDPDLLLGKAYLALGRYRLPSNFFVLERLQPAAWQPAP